MDLKHLGSVAKDVAIFTIVICWTVLFFLLIVWCAMNSLIYLIPIALFLMLFPGCYIMKGKE